MEWKPKPISQSQRSIKVPVVVDPEDELEKKLKESHISDDKHVIIPNHLHVPEAEKLDFCFGSFDAIFGFNKTPSNSNGPVAVTMSEKTSEASEEADETIEDQMQSRNENADGEEDHHEQPTTSSSNVPKNLPTEGDMSLNAGPECRELKQETSSSSSSSSSLPTPSHQYPAVHTSPNPNFSFGFMPPMIGSQVTSFENTKSQARDASHVPSFVVRPYHPYSVMSIAIIAIAIAISEAMRWCGMQFNHDNVRPIQLQSVEVLPKKVVNILKEIRDLSGVLSGLTKESNIDNFLGDFLKYNESSIMKLPCKIFDPIPLGEAAVVGRMKDADSVAMPEGSSLYDLVQTRITTTHASVGVVVRLREELSLVKDKPAHFAIDQG
ncbi:hypothetical protein Lser_V15G39816 [Lactuca serriola]